MVVVTIIVVLLALLVPAMDRAIYQAELAVCAANLDAIGGGATIYALDHKRRYPLRLGVEDRNLGWQMRQFSDGLANVDDRPIIRDHIPIKTLQCPMSEQIDLEPRTNALGRVDGSYYAGYDLWYGWKYDLGGTGMMKLGDRWGWDGRRYDIVAGDFNLFHIGNPYVISSHPDDEGKLVVRATPGYTDWIRSDKLDRGLIDQNYVFADGSVARYAAVEMLDDGGRRTAVPWADIAGNQPSGWQLFVPVR